MWLIFLVRFAVAIKTDLELGFAAGLHRRRQVNVIVPHSRAGMRETGDRSLPANILAGSLVPSQRHGPLRNAAGLSPSKLRPILRGRRMFNDAKRRSENDRETSAGKSHSCIYADRVHR